MVGGSTTEREQISYLRPERPCQCLRIAMENLEFSASSRFRGVASTQLNRHDANVAAYGKKLKASAFRKYSIDNAMHAEPVRNAAQNLEIFRKTPETKHLKYGSGCADARKIRRHFASGMRRKIVCTSVGRFDVKYPLRNLDVYDWMEALRR